MDFSVVVPIYNVAKYLPECINSILSQTYGNFELILVNDGSTDNSLEICRNFAEKDDRIIIINKPNGGLVSARKAGFLRARGEYTVSVDGDDFIDKNLLCVLHEEISVKKYDIVIYQGYSYTDGSLNTINQPIQGRYSKHENWQEVEKYLIGGITASVPWIMPGIVFKAVKTSIIKNNLKYYDDRVKMGEDLLISTACMLDAEEVLFLKGYFYYYRRFLGQMTSGYKKNLISNEEVLIKMLFNVADGKNFPYLKSNIMRHALELSKSAIYNEVKNEKGKKMIVDAISAVIKSSYYTYFKELNVKSLTKMEKMFYYMIKYKLKNMIYFSAKLCYRRHHD